VSEVDSAGVFTHFVYASNAEESGAPIALIRAGVFYRVVKDHLGSVRLIVNATTGEVAQSIDYDAYGRVINETGAGFQPFGFAGGLYDATTKLVRFGARDYDPSTGRWTNKDPIGFAGQQGNVYLYVNGDPVNRLDLRGKDDLTSAIGGSISAVGFGILFVTVWSNPVGWAIVAGGIGFAAYMELQESNGNIDSFRQGETKAKEVTARTKYREQQLREFDEMSGTAPLPETSLFEERQAERVFMEGFGEGLCSEPTSPCYEGR
jgi:RHS repeat-associated protein